MTIANEKGNIMVYVAITIMTIAALIIGSFYMNTSSYLSEFGARDENRTYLLALSGKYYALNSVASLHNAADNTATNGQVFVLDSTTGDMFHILINCTGQRIESTGIVKFQTPFETRRRIVIIQGCS